MAIYQCYVKNVIIAFIAPFYSREYLPGFLPPAVSLWKKNSRVGESQYHLVSILLHIDLRWVEMGIEI